jgi:VWFA-related protein
MKNLCLAILLCLFPASGAFAQGQANPTPQQTPQDIEVIRVSTELVQTDVMVFDKDGHFIDGLQRDQFELRVDGKPQPLSLFDRVVSGSQKEAQLVSRGNAAGGSTASGSASSGEQRGRTIIFFIDDLHLSASSVMKTRQAILGFIEKEMNSGDQVAVASATGQIGFLQQFTDNKSVLRAAVGRLNYRPYTVTDSGATMTMTEYQALRVDAGDRDTIQYYATNLLRESNVTIPGAGGVGPPRGGPMGQPIPRNGPTSGMTRESAERMIKERANVMLKQSGSVTNNTLLGLESLMRSSAQLPGRKLVFLFSDGFFLNDRNTGFGEKLKHITDAAVRSGAVIYTLDARGLMSMTDVSSNRPDPEGHLSRSNIGEISASQDPLFALAEDTGGRALLNSDALKGAVTKALAETSNYYLLAWRPSDEEQKSKNYKRIEVSVIGHPELVVKLPKGYMQSQADAEMARVDADGNRSGNTTQPVSAGAKDQPVAPKSVDGELRSALLASANRHALPTMVSVTFLDTPNNGPIITASVQAATTGLDYGVGGKEAATIDLAGVVLNDQGKPATTFKTRLNVTHLDSAQDGGVVYTYKAPLTPGLYQVRAAARDQKSGKVGSASQWIEIPDLSKHQLTLSSLLLGAQVVDVKPKADATKAGAPTAEPQVLFSVDRRFKKSSRLGFWIFAYNATRGSNAASTPELTAEIEVLNNANGQSVMKSPVRKLDMTGMSDLQRIPFGSQFSLATLPAGRYELNVKITDQIARSSASQRLSFQVE